MQQQHASFVRRVYELSRGDPNTPVSEEQVRNDLGMSEDESNDAFRDLRDRGLLWARWTTTVSITEAGIAAVAEGSIKD